MRLSIPALAALAVLGLALPSPIRAEAGRIAVGSDAWRDSLDRKRSRDDAWLRQFKAELAMCRVNALPTCQAKAYGALAARPVESLGGWSQEAAADTAVGFLLGMEGDRAYAKLLARAKVSDQPDHIERPLIRKLLKHRQGMAFTRFASLPAPPPDLTDTSRAEGKTPSPPKEWSPAFQKAWTTRKAMEARQRKLRDQDTTEATGWTYAALYRSILDFLRRDDPAILDAIRPFEWRGWCGTGSEELYGPKEDALLIVDLERGDLPMAMLRTSDPIRIRQMLMARGLDWEGYFLGAIPGSYSDAQSKAFGILARFGSVESFRALLTMEPTRYGYPFGFEAAIATYLIRPGSRIPLPERVRFDFELARDAEAPALPADLRKQGLARLTAPIDRNPYAVETSLLVGIFSRVEFPERVKYLKILAAVPDPEARETAVRALARLGSDPGPLPPLEPVTFLITSKGKPFGRSRMEVGYPCRDADTLCRDEMFNRSIDEERFAVDRRNYLEAWHAAKALTLSNFYVGSDFLDDALFHAVVPLVEHPSGPIPVDIPLHRMTLDLSFPKGFPIRPGNKMRVSIRRLERAAGSHRNSNETELRNRVVFGKVGSGPYEVGVEAPGLQSWLSDTIQVRGDTNLAVTLKKGREVHFAIRSSREGDSGFDVRMRLSPATVPPEDSQRMARSGWTPTFTGLGLGRHTLELTAGDGSDQGAMPTRSVRSFVLTDQSRDTVDLGGIWIDPPGK